MVYFVATKKQAISSTELSRKQGLTQKTYWSLKLSDFQSVLFWGSLNIETYDELILTAFTYKLKMRVLSPFE